MQSDDPVIVKNMATETRFGSPQLLRDHRVVSGMSVVIRGYQKPFGVFGAHSTREIQFTRDDINFLQAIANVLANAIERTRAEQALRESEALYRQAIEAAGAVPYYQDYGQAAYPFMGDGIAQMTGYSPQEMTPELWNSIVLNVEPLGEAAGLGREEALRRARAGEFKTWHSDLLIRTRDGKTRWVSDSAVEILDRHRVPKGSIGILQDITERKHAAETLRETRDRLAATLDALPDLMFEVDRDGCILDYRAPNTTELYVAPEAFLGKRVSQVLPEPAAQIVMDAITRASENGRDRGAIYSLDTPRGIGWYELSVAAKGDPHTSQARFVTLVRDVTDRKRAEGALRLSEERYRTLVENLPNSAIILYDRDLRFILVDGPEVTRSGYSKAKMEGKTLYEALPDEFVRAVEPNMRAVLEGKSFTAELPFDESFYSYTYFPLRNFAGEIEHGLILAQNVTARKKAEMEREHFVRELQMLAQRLVELEEAERRRLAQELHDQVGQTLTALSINLNVIKSQLPKKSAGKAALRLDDSLNLVEQTVQLIRNVMADLRPAVLDDYGLYAALEWYCKQFERRTQIRTRVEGKEFSPRLSLGMETVLFRIAQEALTNVAKHAHATHITVSLEETGVVSRLVVSDDGVGFLAAETRGQTLGGMGLWTMRERALSVKGELRVESAPGQGTRIIAKVER